MAKWKIFKAMKAIFRRFEMAYRLRINMWKRKLYGIGIKDRFLQEASQFMEFKVDNIPLKFLGVTVGGNPGRVDIWKLVVPVIKLKLSSWKGRFLSMDGRVTLINYVLMNIHVYYLSVFKAPVKVIHEITSIQRNFLWKGYSDKCVIAWIS